MEALARHALPASSKPRPGPPHAPSVLVADTLRPRLLLVRAPALPALPTLRRLQVCVAHYHITSSHRMCTCVCVYLCETHYHTGVRHIIIQVWDTLSHHHIACHIIISRTLLCLCVCARARARECQHACRCDLRTGKHTYANAQTHMDMHAHMQLITHTRSWAYMSSTLQRPFFVCFADTS